MIFKQSIFIHFNGAAGANKDKSESQVEHAFYIYSEAQIASK